MKTPASFAVDGDSSGVQIVSADPNPAWQNNRYRLDLQSVMSGNDFVELLTLDERVWAMSMNGTQMPELTAESAARWSVFWSTEDRPKAMAALDRARRGQVGRFEARIAMGRTTMSWWDVVITPVLDQHGEPESLLATSRDITHTKQLESRLGFLAESGKVLGSSLNIDETLGAVVRLAVPTIASWCMVAYDVAGPKVARCAADSAMQSVLDELLPPWSVNGTIVVDQTSSTPAPGTIRRDDFFTAVRALQSRSVVVVPILSRNDAIGTLSVGTAERNLTSDDVILFEELAGRIGMALENARLFARQTRVARALQDAMLPTNLPQLPDLVLSSCYVPGKSEAEVGGDWYDAFPLSQGRVLISIGDVCGSGLAAAVTMGHLRQAIRAIARTTADPAKILDLVSDQLALDAPTALATAVVTVYDTASRRIAYAIAGHPPPLIRSASGELRELHGPGLPLGIRDRAEPPTQTVDFPAGSLLVLYTDGLIEGSRDIVVGTEILHRSLARLAPSSFAAAAQRTFEMVVQSNEVNDDVAIVTLAT